MATTGIALLPDIGSLKYNGVDWTCLYESRVSGEDVLDSAGRTTKFVKYSITVDGIVTLQFSSDLTIDRQMALMKQKLSQPAGILTYSGKGFGNPFAINVPGGTLFDVAWGPIPKVLEFTPLGASRSARVIWTVTTCIPETTAKRLGFPVLQFCFSTAIGYDADGYSQIGIKGVLEIAITRPRQSTVTMVQTVDDFRNIFLSRLTDGFDLTRFKMVNRSFEISEDKRTLSFDFQWHQLAPMGNPAVITTASGEFSMRPEKPVIIHANAKWLCTLRATYTVPPGKPRRVAYLAFAAMWRFRMIQSQLGGINAAGQPINPAPQPPRGPVFDSVGLYDNVLNYLFNNNLAVRGTAPPLPQGLIALNPANQKAIPISFSVSEGLYEDSKNITFEAQWRLFSTLRMILVSTGIWRRSGLEGGNLWASSVRNISGPNGPLINRINPAAQAIVDFGNP